MTFITPQKLMLAVFLSGLLSAATRADESQFNETVSVGNQAPQFADLPGTDGKTHGLADYEGAKAVVIVFTSNQCPVAIAYEDRLVALQKEYGERGVQLVAICSNFEFGNELEQLKERAEAKQFNFLYLRDDTQQTGRAYGASHTPEVFLLDGDRRIVYMGAFDDNEDPAKVSKTYLRDAIDLVLDGKSPEVKEVQPFGCRIRYKRRAASRASS